MRNDIVGSATKTSKVPAVKTSWHTSEPKSGSHKKTRNKHILRASSNESESQILAEAAVDISEILLGDGIYQINPLQDRVKLAITKAELIKKAVAHDKYDSLLPASHANALPKITPSALLSWLDGEFKDVMDAVFFVDSETEFAKILQAFAQGIATNFSGDKVKVKVVVETNGMGLKKKHPATSDAAAVQQAI